MRTWMSSQRAHSKGTGAVVFRQNQVIAIYTSVAIFMPNSFEEFSVTPSILLPPIYTFPLDLGARELA